MNRSAVAVTALIVALAAAGCITRPVGTGIDSSQPPDPGCPAVVTRFNWAQPGLWDAMGNETQTETAPYFWDFADNETWGPLRVTRLQWRMDAPPQTSLTRFTFTPGPRIDAVLDGAFTQQEIREAVSDILTKTTHLTQSQHDKAVQDFMASKRQVDPPFRTGGSPEADRDPWGKTAFAYGTTLDAGPRFPELLTFALPPVPPEQAYPEPLPTLTLPWRSWQITLEQPLRTTPVLDGWALTTDARGNTALTNRSGMEREVGVDAIAALVQEYGLVPPAPEKIAYNRQSCFLVATDGSSVGVT